MKRAILIAVSLAAISVVRAGIPPPQVASPTDINSGTDTMKYVSPYGLAHSNYSSSASVLSYGFSFDAGVGSVLTAYTSSPRTMASAGTITGWYLRGDTTGSVTVDIRKATAGGSFTSVTASATPALSSSAYAHGTTLTGWTTAFAAGDSFIAVITGTPAALQQVTLVVTYQ